jgi:alanine racemase
VPAEKPGIVAPLGWTDRPVARLHQEISMKWWPGRKVTSRERETKSAGASSVTGGPALMETGGMLTVDLDAIATNWRILATRVAPADCAAVVKADAYGCGVREVAAALVAAGCKTFFVAFVSEARAIREITQEATIYVLNGMPPGGATAFAEVNARPVIGNMGELVEWDAFCSVHSWTGGTALHFDTGMNRLGLPISDAPALAARMKTPTHGIALVMSHLACADEPEHPLNAVQIQRFRELRMMFRGINASLANSSGIFLGSATHCDVVRPGAALYGINPTPGSANPMRPVVELKGRIAQVRTVPRGETVGYGATWTASRDARLAVIAVGYGDGHLGATAALAGEQPMVIISGERCPVVGRISMDLLAVDVSALPEKAARRGDFATLIGDGLSVDDLARFSDTIGYEVLTSLGRRHHRVWTFSMPAGQERSKRSVVE